MNELIQKSIPAYRYILISSYIGTSYYGSQRLSARGATDGQLSTVQESLETSLGVYLPKESCILTSGSRTDRGVHALMNVFSLPLIQNSISTSALKTLLNEDLFKRNQDIMIKDVLLAPYGFHPRRFCVSREYIYRLAVLNDQTATKLEGPVSHKPIDLATRLPITELHRSLPIFRLDLDKTQQVIELYNGEHDFRTFAQKTDADTIRKMEISIVEEKHVSFREVNSQPFTVYQIHLKSSSFLHNQVRRMIGALLSFATYGRISLDKIKGMLEGRSEQKWPYEVIVAEPYGLYLKRLNYNKSSLQGFKRTHGYEGEEYIDPDTIEGSSDEDLSDDRKRSNERHSQVMMEKLLEKKLEEGQ